MDDGPPDLDTRDEHDGLRAAARRVRWRLSGAWQLPTFGLTTLAGAIVIHLLPLAGEQASVPGAFLLAGFANLIVMAILAKPGGWLLRRTRPALPAAIAVDRAGTALMAAVLVLFIVLGVAHRGAVQDARDADARQLVAARAYLTANAPAEYVRHIGSPSVWKQADFLYRTCFAGTDERKNLCLIVDLSRTPPRVTPDPDQQPNSVVAGPDNPGRHGQ